MILVSIHTVDIPYFDDFEYVEVVTGHRPVSWAWLWSLHNEHRNFVPRLLYLATFWTFGGDFRAPHFLNAAVLALSAAMCILAARKVRGHTELVDVAFPLLLMHWDHSENLLWGHQVQMTVTTLLSLGALAGMIAKREPSLLTSTWTGALVAMLPASGANGLLLAIPFEGWLLWSAWTQRRGPGAGRRLAAAMNLMWFAATAFLCCYYLVGYYSNENHPHSPGPFAVLRCALEFLTTSLGSSGQYFWPGSGIVIALVLGTTLVHTLWTARREPEARLRMFACIGAIVGVVLVALAVGWGRSGFGKGFGFAKRYMSLAAPALCATHLAWTCTRRAALGRVIPFVVLLLTAGGFALAFSSGEGSSRARSNILRRIVLDALCGATSEAIADRHGAALYPVRSELVEALDHLKEAQLGPWRVPKEFVDREICALANAPGGALRWRPSHIAFGPLRPRFELVDWLPALVLPAPGELRFPILGNTRRFFGRFGVLTDFEAAPPATASRATPAPVRFTIAFEGPGGNRTQLLTRVLDAWRTPGDSGAQSFDIPMGELGSGEIVCRTEVDAPLGSDVAHGSPYWQGIDVR